MPGTVGIVTSRVLLVTEDRELVRATAAALDAYPVTLLLARSRSS